MPVIIMDSQDDQLTIRVRGEIGLPVIITDSQSDQLTINGACGAVIYVNSYSITPSHTHTLTRTHVQLDDTVLGLHPDYYSSCTRCLWCSWYMSNSCSITPSHTHTLTRTHVQLDDTVLGLHQTTTLATHQVSIAAVTW